MYRKAFIDLYLKDGFIFEDAKNEIDFVLETLFNYTYKDFLLGKTLSQNQIAKTEKIIKERIKTRRPIQQITGQAFFYNRRFLVNESTLIPRPETELLVSEVLKLSQNIENPKILDIGTGSGCIPITLCLENSKITAHSVDILSSAIETAKKNALLHNVYEKIRFFKSDLFENIEEKYDIIVSNPPYIPLKEKENLQVEVKDFDPPEALFTNDEYGIEYYEKIITESHDYLSDNGYLAFELGVNQCKLVEKILKANKYRNINIIKDFNNINRVIISRK